jgi:hypothetical protein
MKRRSSILLLALIVLLAGCRKDEQATPMDPGHAYFPDQVGRWVEYQVDSAWRIDAVSVNDSKSYRLRQVIAAHYTDQAGRPALRIERFVLEEGEWVIRDVWSAVRTTTGAEMTEENVRLLKLSFPVREGRTWDINVLNPEPEFLVAARDVGSAFSVNGMDFPNTVTVRSTLPANLIETNSLEERYAHGVGLVEHHWYYRRAANTSPSSPITEVDYSMVAVAYGTE